MKSSVHVHLVLLGSAMTVGGCAEGPLDVQQQRYTSIEQCREDWKDPKDCQQVPSTVSPGTYVAGPRYYWDSANNRPMAYLADGTARPLNGSGISASGSRIGTTTHTSVVRGGFGATGAAHGGGGSS